LNITKKILFGAGILFVVIQFIQPAKNKAVQTSPSDISKVLNVPDTIHSILRDACYDCHSNNTNYPLYGNIQPAEWLMAYHIKEAKNQLNFNEFGSYSPRRQLSKLDGIANSLMDNVMPLKSYKILHKSAQLSLSEKSLLINWAQQSIDSLSVSK
jgi:hypothetical protein